MALCSFSWACFAQCAINAKIPQGFVLGPTVSLLCRKNFPNHVICSIITYTGDTSLASEYGQASDLY